MAHAAIHPDEYGPAPLFDAVLYPHRSLSERGFAKAMAVLAGIVFAVGVSFALAGAWLVLPFFGCEILLIWLAFRLNSRAARAYETLRLTPDALTVAQVRPSGQRHETSFRPPHWLRVELAAQPGGDTALTLASHGRSLVVGRFLTQDERREVAAELSAALNRLAAAPSRS